MGRRNLNIVNSDVESDGSVGFLEPEVLDTLEALELGPEHRAQAALAVSYARTIDEAENIAKRLRKLPPSEDTEEELGRLRARVSAHVTMSELGPKLQQSLDYLLATPKSQDRARKKEDNRPAAGKLAALRGGA